MERLDKILSSQGVGSRKEAGILIRRGLVHVNGILATRPETKTDPERDQITIEGKPLRFQRHVYLMMNKPAGVVSASRDSREKTVVDLVPPALSRRDLFPAGRQLIKCQFDKQHDLFIVKIFEKGGVFIAQFTD